MGRTHVCAREKRVFGEGVHGREFEEEGCPRENTISYGESLIEIELTQPIL